jgi:hypothetical protein
LKKIDWSTQEEVRLLERAGINRVVLLSRGALEQLVWTGNNFMGDVVLEKKEWYVVLRTPEEMEKPKDECWSALNAVLNDQCNELLWFIFHTCENHKNKDNLVEKLDAYMDIKTGCVTRTVGPYMKQVFNIDDADNWMLH